MSSHVRFLSLLLSAPVLSCAQDAPAASQFVTVKSGALEIVSKGMFSASAATVFEAMTVCDHIRQWMRPEHMTLIDCSIEPRVEGTMTLVFAASRGRRIEVRGRYRVFEAPHRIAYLESYDFSPLEMIVTATLEAVGERTRFTQTLTYRMQAERDEDFANIESSVPAMYARLDRYLQSVKPRA